MNVGGNVTDGEFQAKLALESCNGIIPSMASPYVIGTRFGLGLKLSVFVAVLVLIVSGALGFFLISQSAASRKEAMEQQVASLSRMIGAIHGSSLERESDRTLLRMYVEQAHEMKTGLCFALFLNAREELVDGYFNSRLLDEAMPDFQVEGGVLEYLAAKDWSSGDEQVRAFRIGLRSKAGQNLGYAILGFSTVEMNEEIFWAIIINAIVTGVAFLLALFSALVFARRFVLPIKIVAKAMQQVSEGDLDRKLDIRRTDEVGILAKAFNIMVKGLKDRERIRSTFARYVSDQVAERILKEENELNLEGELRKVTVLFLDIRGFTSLSEFLKPSEVVALLNDYFKIIIKIIFDFEGTINKFIGDSIMAIFGAPATLRLPELRAVMTAIEIQRAVGEHNWLRMQQGKPVVNFGIGIHSGEAIAGNIGSELRMEYTVIGRDVNLAQRIESNTKEGQILISDSTAQRIKEFVDLKQKDAVFVKGVLEPVQLWEVLGTDASTLEKALAMTTEDY